LGKLRKEFQIPNPTKQIGIQIKTQNSKTENRKRIETEKNRGFTYLAIAHRTGPASQSNRGPGHLPNRY
jgi:hypothetical protein